MRKALEMLYKDDLKQLCERSLKGTVAMFRCKRGVSRYCPPKLPLTPVKVQAIRFHYNQRITQKVSDSTDYRRRISDTYFNKILNGALSNFAKPSASNDVIEEIVLQ